MKKHTAGILNGAIAAASYGTNPLFALNLYAEGIGVNSVLFYRYALGVVIYGLWLKFIKKSSFKIPLAAIFPLFILGVVFSLSSLSLFGAFNYIDAGIACTILFIYPVLVAIIMAVFFKEKTTKSVILSIILTFAGIALLYKGNTVDLNVKGVLIVFLSALLYAIYIVGIKKIKQIKHIKPAIMSFYVMLFGLLVYVVNLKFCTELQMLTKPSLWCFALALAVIPTIVSLETITIAIKLIGATKTALLGALEPLTALFFGVVIFHEQLTARIIAGIVLIIAGVSLVILNNTEQRTTPDK